MQIAPPLEVLLDLRMEWIGGGESVRGGHFEVGDGFHIGGFRHWGGSAGELIRRGAGPNVSFSSTSTN